MTEHVQLIKDAVINTFDTEIETLQGMRHRMANNESGYMDNIVQANMLIFEKTANRNGKVFILAVGKSLIIGQKLAASLKSTGCKAEAVQAEEAMHGDLGNLEPSTDVVLAISNSGSTDCLVKAVRACKAMKAPIITYCDKPESPLAKLADVNVLLTQGPERSCPLGLAPMDSTTGTLVIGDAFTVAQMKLRNFSADQFARSHPAGALGRTLLLKAKDVMFAGRELPVISTSASIFDAMLEISKYGLGFGIFLNEDFTIAGFIAEGDIRRSMEKNGGDAMVNLYSQGSFAKEPICVDEQMLAREAKIIAEQGVKNNEVSGLVVVNADKQVVGVLQTKELRAQLS